MGNGIGPAADIYEKAPTGGAVLLRSAPKHSISVAAKLSQTHLTMLSREVSAHYRLSSASTGSV